MEAVRSCHHFRRSGKGDDAVLNAVEIDAERLLFFFCGLLFRFFVFGFLFLGLFLFGLFGGGLGFFFFIRVGLFEIDLVALRGERRRHVGAQRYGVNADGFGIGEFEIDYAEDFVEIASGEEIEILAVGIEDGIEAAVEIGGDRRRFFCRRASRDKLRRLLFSAALA